MNKKELNDKIVEWALAQTATCKKKILTNGAAVVPIVPDAFGKNTDGLVFTLTSFPKRLDRPAKRAKKLDLN